MTAEHGQTRNFRQVVERGESVALSDATGRTFYQGPIHWHSYTSCDRWCDHCHRWVEVEGVLGEIKWMATHRGGNCGA